MNAKSLLTTMLLSIACSLCGSAASSSPAEEPQTISAEDAFDQVSQNAEKGDPRAMLTLGAFYEQGIGAPRNYIHAMRWYGKAADKGMAEGQYNLGVCYEIGMGNGGDMQKALQLYEKAAGQGLVIAMHKLASLYISGSQVTKNNEMALKWLNAAADKGDADAANTLGVIYLQGLLNRRINEKKAFDYFMRAVNAGHLEAIKNLAVIYMDGLGRKKDPALALQWYLIAQKGGYKADNLDSIITGLKEKLRPVQVDKAEEESNNWIKVFLAKNQPNANK